jgi:thymidylate synthase (FAD)
LKPYAELLEFNQPNPIRKEGYTRIRDQFLGLKHKRAVLDEDDLEYPHVDIYDPERIMEFAGRWDYGPNNARKLGEMSKVRVPDPETGDVFENEVPIILKYLSMGHESMIEMGDATFFIECSRAVSHQLVRHRIMSIQQESQRFVKYDEAGSEDFYTPDGAGRDNDTLRLYEEAIGYSIGYYRALRKAGVSPQEARYVLPNAMRTRMIVKANARQWRHVIKLRADTPAQPEMRELMNQIHEQLADIFPNAMKGALEGERGIQIVDLEEIRDRLEALPPYPWKFITVREEGEKASTGALRAADGRNVVQPSTESVSMIVGLNETVSFLADAPEIIANLVQLLEEKN